MSEINMSQDQLNRAIGLIQAGKKESAREILLELVELEPYHVSVWMWLAETMPDDEQRISVLKACLKQNPDSLMAKRGLQRFLESQKLKRKPSIENAPTVPLPLPHAPEKPAPIPGQQAAKSSTPRGTEHAQLRSRMMELSRKPVDEQQPGDIPAFRDAMLGNKKLPTVEPWSDIRDKLKPTTSEVGKRPSISQQGLDSPPKYRKPRFPKGSKKSPPVLRYPGISRWVLLGMVGALVVGMVAVTGFLLREPLGEILGWGGVAATRSQDVRTQPTSAMITTDPVIDTQTVQGPFSDSTPTRNFTPTLVVTTSLAYTFENPVLQPEMGKQIVKFAELPASPAQCVAFSSDNRWLAAGMQDGTVFIWDLATQDVVQILQGHSMAVNAVAFSPDARYVVSGSDDGTVQTWDLETLQLVFKMTHHQMAVTSVAFSPNGTMLALGSLDGTIDLWDFGGDGLAGQILADSGVSSLDFSPDGKWLLYGTVTGEIVLWDIPAGSGMKVAHIHTGAVNSLQFMPNGEKFASGSADQSVKLWDTASGKILYTVGSHTDSVKSLSFSPDGRLLASAALGNSIKMWDVANQQEVASLRHTLNIAAVAFSRDGRALAAALSPIGDKDTEGGVIFWGVSSRPVVVPAPERLTVEALQVGEWSPGFSLTLPRAAPRVVALANGQLLIIGGGKVSIAESFTQQVELYDPSSGEVSSTGSMNVSRGEPSATLLFDGRVLVVGGTETEWNGIASAEIYDPASGMWSLTQPLYNHGYYHTATPLSDGRILVAGGCQPSGTLARAELFDPRTDGWTEIASMPEPRCGHTATLLANGHVLIASGWGAEWVSAARGFRYDPNINQWQPTGSLVTPRIYGAAVLMSTGQVMLAGGMANNEAVNAVEIFDPDTGEWKVAEPMAQDRIGHSITRLSSGLVLVVGGAQSVSRTFVNFRDSVEVYDPVAKNWTAIAALNTPRAFHAASFLPDGRVMLIGGITEQDEVLFSTEILVPGKPSPGDNPTPSSTQPVQVTPTSDTE